MVRTSLILVMLLATVGLVLGDSTLSMANSANVRFNLQKGDNFIISNNDVTYMTFLEDDTSVFNQGVRLTASHFSRPGALRYQDGDASAFLNNQWRSMTTTASRSSLPASTKRSVVSRAVATGEVAPEAELVMEADNWYYTVNENYLVGSAELSSQPIASRVSIHPVTGQKVVSIALENSSVVTLSCNNDCSEAGLQISHSKLSNASTLAAEFVEEEYMITTESHTQSYSLDRVAFSNCNSEKAGTMENVSGQLMTCSALKSAGTSTKLFAYLSLVPENQF